MTHTIQTLSEAVAKKLGIESNIEIEDGYGNKDIIWLVDDTKRMAELAWSNGLTAGMGAIEVAVYFAAPKPLSKAFYTDHNNDIPAATRWAIGLAIMEME